MTVTAGRYDVICRDGTLGPLLTALFLARTGKRVLVLPPRLVETGTGEFLLPVVSHGAAGLLAEADLLTADVLLPAANWFRLFSGKGEFSCPADRDARQEAFAASCRPVSSWWRALLASSQALGRRLEEALSSAMMVPPLGLRDYGRMIGLLAADRELLEKRQLDWASFLQSSGLDEGRREFFLSLPVLMSQFNYAHLPYLSVAYGLHTWSAAARLVDLDQLQRRLREQLRLQGAEFADRDCEIIFDGKWYIGIGTEGRVACRSGIFVGAADRERLELEIRPLDRRRDFFRQFDHREAGYRLYRLTWPTADAGERDSEATGAGYFFPPAAGAGEVPAWQPRRLDGGAGRRPATFSWLQPAGQPPAGDAAAATLAACCRVMGVNKPAAVDWQTQIENGAAGPLRGCRPRLAPVLGGAFLPVTGIYQRFYHVGWENLPGFGLNGLIWSARKTADHALASAYL
ncbi:MAG: hypothetical protein JRJ56_03885 [Deltaproteobacteria bacterium]|nr:hypothetical protein [Deltaproteobacteria bacterium]